MEIMVSEWSSVAVVSAFYSDDISFVFKCLILLKIHKITQF